MADHTSELESLFKQLSLLGESITNNMLMIKMFIALSANYKHFYSAWDSVSNEQVKFKN